MWQAHRERRRRTKQTHAKLDQNNVSKALTEVAEAITEEPITQTPAARLPSIVAEGEILVTIKLSKPHFSSSNSTEDCEKTDAIMPTTKI